MGGGEPLSQYVIVLKEFRGDNLSQKMLAKVEEVAKSKGCCKLTLEVLNKNTIIAL